MVWTNSISDYLFYRRPDYVHPASSSSSVMDSDASTLRTSSVSSRGVPEQLSFDKILNHETCPPCTTLDFYNYLNHKVHCAETLQFYLWLRDYTHRYNSPTSLKDTATQKVWTAAQHEEALHKFQREVSSKKTPLPPTVHEILKGTMFSNDPKTRGRGDSIPPPTGTTTASTLVGNGQAVTPWEMPEAKVWEEGRQSNSAYSTTEERYTSIARAAYQKFGLAYPFFHPAFRLELETIIATYIVEDAPRQLNLSASERFCALSALQATASPTAFHYISKNVESSLRQQHHPNFVLDAICNGNRPRVIFARGLGAALILLGIILAVVLSMSHKSRGWRWFSMLFWVLGVSTSMAAWKGMCVVLHGLHHRHVRPWEMFQTSSNSLNTTASTTHISADTELGTRDEDPLNPRGTGRNDATTKYWMERYGKRNIVRKIFDREVWIQEPALRQVQDKIFVQALVVALLGSLVVTCVWVFAVPKGGLY